MYVAALDQVLALQVACCSSLDVTAPSRCEGWTVGDVLAHSVSTTAKLTRFALGRTDAPRTEPVSLPLAVAAAESRAAWAATDLTRTCRLPFGTFTADEAAGVNLFDALAHTWDCAPDVDAPEALWLLGSRAVGLVSLDRAHYARALVPAPQDGPRERFLKELGRSPY